MKIHHYYDVETNALSYVVYDSKSRDAVVIDPLLNFDPATGDIGFDGLNALNTFIEREQLHLKMILETHVHADHLSAAYYVKQRYPRAQLAIGSGVTAVQNHFAPLFNTRLPPQPFDRLLTHGERVQAGSLAFTVLATPGHTPSCSSYLFGDALFTGDALFMPDSGTGRCDFPGGSSTSLYNGIQKHVYSLPDSTRIFVGHDYQPQGRNLAFMTTVGEEKISNSLLKATTSLEEFVNLREQRDKTLKPPRLLLPSIQVNICGGQLPQAEDNGTPYLKIPLRLPPHS